MVEMADSELLSPRVALLPDPKHDAFVTALLEHGTLKAAAEAVGVRYPTAKRWFAREDVRSAYDESRREVFRQVMAHLVHVSVEAIDALRGCLSPDINPAVRVQAAQVLLSQALKSSDMLEFDDRIRQVESALHLSR